MDRILMCNRIRLATLGAAALVLCANPHALRAMTFAPVEKTCPYDGTKFTAQLQMSGTTFGAALDYRPVGAIMSPSPLAVCPTNGFIFLQESYSDEELERLRPLILSPEFQALKDETPYYRAAWIREHTGASHFQVSVTLLQATWESYQSPDRYARYANELLARLPADIELLARLPADIADATGETKRRLQIVAGELLRRLRRFDQSKQHFTRMLSEIDPVSDEGLIARYEIDLAEKRDGEPHVIQEAIAGKEADPDVWSARHAPRLGDGRLLKQTRLFRYDGGRAFVWMPDGSRIIGHTRDRLASFEMSSDQQPDWRPFAWGATLFGVRPDGKTILAQLDHKPLAAPYDKGPKESQFGQIDAKTFDLVASAPAPPTQNMALAFDGKSALAAVKDGLLAYDLQSNEVRSLPSPGFRQDSKTPWIKTAWIGTPWMVAADPSGPRVVLLDDDSIHDDGIVIWNYQEGRAELELHPEGWRKSMTSVGAAFSPDGTRLFVAADIFASQECELTAWDPQSGKLLARKRVKGMGARLSLSSDKRYVGLACRESLTVWDYDLGETLETMTSPAGQYHFVSLAFAPDARRLAVLFGSALVVYAIEPGRQAVP